MLGLKTDQEVLGELVKTKAPAVGQLMDQYPGIWMLVVSRWFICLYIDILPIEVRRGLGLMVETKKELVPTRSISLCFRQFFGSGIVFSTRAPRFFSASPWLSSSTTSPRSWGLALCPTCASASNKSPAELSPWTATPSCRCDKISCSYISTGSSSGPKTLGFFWSYVYWFYWSQNFLQQPFLFSRKSSQNLAACLWRLSINWEKNAENE